MIGQLAPRHRRWPPRLGPIAAVIAFALLGSISSAADDGEPDWRLDKVTQTHPVAPGTPIVIANPIGDIRVRPTKDQTVEVLANIQVEAADTAPPRIEVEEREGALHLEIRPTAPVTGKLPRVDLTVFSPRASDLTLRTVAGLAEAKDITGAVDVDTERGDIAISATGPVRSRTVRGGTTITFLAATWQGGSRARSVTGDITVRLARDADVAVEIDTIGTITTDFSLEVTPLGQGERKRARATIGHGSRRLELTSERGRIALLRTWFD